MTGNCVGLADVLIKANIAAEVYSTEPTDSIDVDTDGPTFLITPTGVWDEPPQNKVNNEPWYQKFNKRKHR